MMKPILAAISLVTLAACSNGEINGPPPAADADEGAVVAPPAVTFKPGANGVTTSEVESPIRISYRVIGRPVVGQPTAIDLQFSSSLGTQPFDVAYRINDSTALRLPETQLARVAVSPSQANARGFAAQQVTVIPLREGRLFLNVAAEIETETGSFSSVTAVPIQVGAAAPREPAENGTVATEESGELIRSLPARTD